MTAWGPTTVLTLHALFRMHVDWEILGDFEGTEGKFSNTETGDVLLGTPDVVERNGTVNRVLALRGRILNLGKTDIYDLYDLSDPSNVSPFGQAAHLFATVNGIMFFNRSNELPEFPGWPATMQFGNLGGRPFTWGTNLKDSVVLGAPGFFTVASGPKSWQVTPETEVQLRMKNLATSGPAKYDLLIGGSV